MVKLLHQYLCKNPRVLQNATVREHGVVCPQRFTLPQYVPWFDRVGALSRKAVAGQRCIHELPFLSCVYEAQHSGVHYNIFTPVQGPWAVIICGQTRSLPHQVTLLQFQARLPS